MSHWHLADCKHTDEVTEEDFIEYYDVRSVGLKKGLYIHNC